MKHFSTLLLLLVLTALSFTAAQTTITYTAADEDFINPERGFYSQTQSWNESGALTSYWANNIRKDNQSLMLRLYYLPKWRESELPAALFTMMENDFKLMREAGIKCILRFAYTNQMGNPDAPLNIVLQHLEQLKPIMTKNSDVIAVMQAGFIGAWGEWHSSTNNLENTASRRAILEKILEVLPADRMVQVRTPNYKKAIFNTSTPIAEQNAFDGSNYSRTGHHNDCFLADETDYGTYSDTTTDRTFLSRDARFVPVGGETCNPSIFSKCPNTVYQMERLHWTFINSDYHQTVISGWNTNACMDEIKTRLGYRFELLDGTFTDSSAQGGTFNMSLKIRNIGFASLYNPRNVELILRSEKDTFYVQLPVDPRRWESGDTVSLDITAGLPSEIASGNYTMLFNLPDASPNLHNNPLFSIRTANTDLWEAATGYNKLNLTLNIDPSNSTDVYTGDLIFKKKEITTVVNDIKIEDYAISIANYPNPFNGSTVIDYAIKEAGNVSIKVYNSLGEEVMVLVNEFKNPGEYSVNFNSDAVTPGLTSGIYFYVLQTKTKAYSGKMVLLK